MSLEKLSDETVRRLYENIRSEVAADRRGPQPLMGETARLRAEQIRQEIECAACDSHQSIGLRMSDEIKCEACDGAGVQVVKQPSQSGKRIYLPLCKLCGGKGRVEIRDPNKRQ